MRLKLDLDKIRGYILFGIKKNIIVEKHCTIERPKYIDFKGDNYIARFSEVITTEPNKIIIGKGTRICRHSFLFNAGGTIKIGENCCIGDYCNFLGNGGLSIGDNVIFANGISLISSEHNYQDISRPIKDQGSQSKGITIGDNCWFGIHSTVLDGVNIGKNCVIGAGAIVKNNLPDYSLAVGVPAKIIKIYNPEKQKWERVE